MNFKYLIGALALPALVASCANEDIVLDNNDSLLQERRVVGNVVLDAQKAFGGVDSRWGGPKVGFEAGKDIIGACLMDLPNGTATDYISTNYKFSYNEDEQWISDALFVEGSYYFYMQYNSEMRQRAALQATIPSVQNVGESGNDAVLANQLFLGHYNITTEHTDLSVPVALHEVYARPSFTFSYDGTENVTIEKVVFQKPQFKLTSKLNTTVAMGDAVDYTAYEDATEVDGLTATADAYFDAYQQALVDGEEPADLNAIVPLMMVGQGAGNETITMVPAKEAASISGAILMPAGTISTQTTSSGANYDELKMYIYTNKGIVEAAIPAGTPGTGRAYTRTVKDYAATPTTSTIVPSEYVKVDATLLNTAALYGGEGGSGKAVAVSFKDNAITVPNTLTVNSIEELEKYLTNWYTGKKEAIPTLTVTLGNDITLNANVAAFLANTTNNPAVTFAGVKTITIPSGLAATVLNTITTTTNAIVVAEGAEQTLNNGTSKTFATITNNGTLTIAGDGIADDVDTEDEVYTVTTVVNNGTLTVDYASAITTINNMGTLNVNAALASTTVNNGKNATVYDNEAKAVVKAAVNQIDNYAAVEFNGTFTVATFNNKKQNISTTSVKNYIYGNAEVKGGELTITDANNEGEINVTGGDLLFAGTVTNVAGSETEGYVYSAGEINVSAGKMLSVSGTLTNNGAIVNDGFLANAGSGTINNVGDLNHNSGALTLISTNTGTVVLAEANPTNLTIQAQTGIVEYTAVEGDFGDIDHDDDENTADVYGLKAIDSRITNLIVKEEGEIYLSLLGVKVVDVTINSANGNVVFGNNPLNNLTIQGGTHTIGSVTVKNNFTVEANESVTIPEDAELTYEGEYAAGTEVFTNKGKIFVVGALTATNYYENKVVDADGTFTGASKIYNTGGSTSNITWNTNPI